VIGPATGRLGRVARRWLPGSWQGARVDPGRRGSLALITVAGLAAVVAAVGVWRDRPIAEAAPPLTVLAAPASTDRPGAATTTPDPGVPKGAPLVLSVAGKVRRPGLVTVPDGARVADAIAAAGGPLPRADLTPLNLARRVTDGEQLLVGAPAPPAGTAADGPGPGAAPGGGSASGGTGKVDLNRATLEQLDTLPGVGPVTAQRILDWRAAHGRFTAVEQLREIEGIGERRFGQLKGQVTV
jgi:competence protein ComEA